jgi:hypothetical protein
MFFTRSSVYTGVYRKAIVGRAVELDVDDDDEEWEGVLTLDAEGVSFADVGFGVVLALVGLAVGLLLAPNSVWLGWWPDFVKPSTRQ